MKGICHIWSRGRHFSPSMPGDRYLNLGSKSDLRAEISGNIVRYDALAPRPQVLRSFSSFYANEIFWVLLFCAGASLLELIQSIPSIIVKNDRHGRWAIPQTRNEGSMFIQVRALSDKQCFRDEIHLFFQSDDSFHHLFWRHTYDCIYYTSCF